MHFANSNEDHEPQDDLYTDDFLKQLPSKRVITLATEQNTEPSQSIPQTHETQSGHKKGMGGLSGLMKGDKQANSYLMTKYNIFFNFNQSGQPLIEELIIELPNECTVEECIKESLKLFLQRLEGNTLQSLPPNKTISQNITDYLLYFANKKGERKLDLPALEATQVLSNTHFYRFAIIQKLINGASSSFQIQANSQQEQKEVQQKKEQKSAPQSNSIDLTKYSKNNEQEKRNSNQKKIDSEEMVNETCCLCFTVRREKKK